jgi:hypothetical protein
VGHNGHGLETALRAASKRREIVAETADTFKTIHVHEGA